MSTKAKTESYFDQAADTFLNAFKTCVRLQEETATKCFDLAKKWGETEDWQKQYEDLSKEALPDVKKAAEDTLKFWEDNAKKCMDLLGEGFATSKAPSVTEAQEKLQQLWQESLATMRTNTETMVKLSSEAMQAYVDFMKKNAETVTEAEPAKG